MKRCSRCGKLLPRDAFNVCKATSDGLSVWCRDCFREYNRKRYAAKSELIKEQVAEYSRANPENRLETMLRVCSKKPSRECARRAVSLAVKLGIVSKPDTCSGCGRSNVRIEAHHHDYGKPLDVIWLCKRCHCQVDAQRRRREREERDEGEATVHPALRISVGTHQGSR